MIAIMAVVTGFPLVNTVWLAFTDASLTGQGYDWNWSGLENFAYILDDADFRAAVGHTSYFTLVSVSIEVVLGVLVALLLDQEFCRPHRGAGAADPAMGAADHRQRGDVAADLQSGIRQPQRAADASSACSIPTAPGSAIRQAP